MSNAAAVESVLFAALEKPTPAERDAFLDSACGGDAEFRRQVEKLLKAHSDVGNFLQKPVVEQLAAPPEGPDATQACDAATGQEGPAMPRTEGEGSNNDEDTPLDFLQPSTRPDSLGRLGHYEMLQVLGKGGFGIVFRAFDDTLQRVVAVKVMAPQIATLSPARKRFVREARSSASVRHENVVQIYEVGEQPLPYLTMEFIPGESLQQKLDRCGPLDVREVLRIGRQIAEGLAAAHACDLIHRDIKPGNILLEGGSHKAKITDFGLARAADDASISQSGIVAGTPMFMSPEQALGNKIDQRADLFSLGSVLYQMASGRPPFRAPNTLAVLKRVAEEQPRPIQEIIPETPDWLCGIITKLHAKNPADRFQSAHEVADLLADCEAKLKAKQAVRNVLPVPGKPAAPTTGGRKWIAAAAAVLLPVLALVVTELAGVTDLFRQHATRDPIKPGGGPTPVPVVNKEPLNVGKEPPAVAPFTDADIERIAALPAEQQVEEVRKELMRRNPGFDGTLTPSIQNDAVLGLEFLTDEVDNIAPVRALKGLTFLDCRGTYPKNKGKLSDLSPLKGMSLNLLDCSCTQVADLTALSGMPMTQIYFSHTRVSDLMPLKGMALERLHCASTGVQDLSHLKGMKLESLELSDLSVSDLSPLKGMTSLRLLNLSDMEKLSDLTPLKGIPLIELNLKECRAVRDLEPLKGMPLTKLVMFNTGATDLKPLQGMELEVIRLTPKNITQGLNILRDMKSLKSIGINDSQILPAAEFWARYD